MTPQLKACLSRGVVGDGWPPCTTKSLLRYTGVMKEGKNVAAVRAQSYIVGGGRISRSP